MLCASLTVPRSAYFHSTTTLNHVRSLLTSGFASLHHPKDWSLTHVRSPALRCVVMYIYSVSVSHLLSSEEFERITEGLSDALEFTRTIGLGKDSVSYEQGGGRGALGEVDFYTRSASFYLCPLLGRVPDRLQSRGPHARL